MAKPEVRDTWTEISGATGAARSVVLCLKMIGLLRGADKSGWGWWDGRAGQTRFTLNGHVASPHLLNPFKKKEWKAQLQPKTNED